MFGRLNTSSRSWIATACIAMGTGGMMALAAPENAPTTQSSPATQPAPTMNLTDAQAAKLKSLQSQYKVRRKQFDDVVGDGKSLRDPNGRAATLSQLSPIWRDLESLATAAAPDGWRTPILDTVAHRGIGIGALWPAIEAHRDHLTRTGLLAARRRRFLALAVKGLVGQALQQRVEELAAGDDFARLLGQADGGDLSLHAAGDIALQAVLDRPAAP